MDRAAQEQVKSLKQHVARRDAELKALRDQKSRAQVEHRKENEALRKELTFCKNQMKRLQD